MDLDQPPNAMPATRSTVLAPAAGIVAFAKGRPPKPQMKKSTTKTPSRLAIEGAPMFIFIFYALSFRLLQHVFVHFIYVCIFHI